MLLRRPPRWSPFSLFLHWLFFAWRQRGEQHVLCWRFALTDLPKAIDRVAAYAARSSTVFVLLTWLRPSAKSSINERMACVSRCSLGDLSSPLFSRSLRVLGLDEARVAIISARFLGLLGRVRVTLSFARFFAVVDVKTGVLHKSASDSEPLFWFSAAGFRFRRNLFTRSIPCFLFFSIFFVYFSGSCFLFA